MRQLISFLFFSIAILISCNQPTKTTTVDTSNEKNTPTLREKIGQMLIVGFRDTLLNDQSTITKDITEHKVGGVILYEYDVPTKSRPRNITSATQLKELCENLKSISDIPLFITIDQEGGVVDRLKSHYGFPDFHKSAQELGALNNEDTSRYWANLAATTLKDMSINVNFAPCVDVNIDPESPVIGKIERSFSANPTIVAKEATYVIEEHKKEGVFCVIKHFPGHGSANNDSHKGFTNVTKTWKPEELTPYKQLIDGGQLDMIMTAHVYNTAWDTVPATLSKKVITGMLREEMNWQGVIVSDDMQMGAIADNYGFEVALERSINAGVDMLILSNNSPKPYDSDITNKTINAIEGLISEGKIAESRIEEAYQRIMNLKKGL